MRSLAAALVTVVAVLAAAAPAGAQSAGQAPPGSAAVDQYRESIPVAPGGARKPTKRQREALAAEGRDGRELAATLAATGTDDASTGGGTGGDGGADAPSGGATRDSASGAERTDGGEGGDAGRGTGQDARAAADGDADGAARDGAAPSRLNATASASLGSKLGPVPLWVALTAILVAAVGTVLVRRRAA